jgi:5-carboxymethyl-2-hydroxymuconate isomerase
MLNINKTTGGVMPHFNMEYSANLDGLVDFVDLAKLVHETILLTGLFELGAVRVRAFRSEAYAIADLLPENAFLDMSFRIGQGRSAEEKKAAGEAIFAAVTAHLAPLFQTPHFMLTLEIREIDPVLSWKKNAIHPRIRAQK